MRPLVFLALILAFPVAEAWLLFRLAAAVGGGWVLAWLALAVILGILLIRLEKLVFGVRVLASLREGGSPLRALLGSAKSFVAGLLLIFPGVISDVLALVVLLLPVPAGPSMPSGAGPAPLGDDGVIEGEFRREASERDRLPR